MARSASSSGQGLPTAAGLKKIEIPKCIAEDAHWMDALSEAMRTKTFNDRAGNGLGVLNSPAHSEQCSSKLRARHHSLNEEGVLIGRH
jgi:hypothetical protein